MHLLYLTAALPLGAGETYIIPEILEFRRRGHRVTVVPVRPRCPVVHDDARRLTEATISESILSPAIMRGAFAEVARAPALAVRAGLLLAASRNLRILVKNLAVFPKGLWLAGVARCQGVDHIHAHWASTTATVALVAGVVSGIPWSFTAHRWDIPENNLLREKAREAKFARAIGARAGNELGSLIRPHQDKLRIIHMGVADCAPAITPKHRPPGPLRVLLAANFLEVKGHCYALEAIALLKEAGVDVSLSCAGAGPLKPRIEDWATRLNVLDRVHFRGLVDHEKLLAELRLLTWDVALLPSIETKKDWEGIPVFLIEAMAAGVPVVSTDTGGIPELLDGGAGVLVEAQSAQAIATTLARLASDDDLRNQLAAAGLRRVREQFTIESTISALINEISSTTRPAIGRQAIAGI